MSHDPFVEKKMGFVTKYPWPVLILARLARGQPCGSVIRNGIAVTMPTLPRRFTYKSLGWSHFARRYFGNRVCFFFLELLRCFNSLGYLYLFYEFKKEFVGCPIRESSGQSIIPARRSVSSVSTPFIVFGCLGIHHKPLFFRKRKTLCTINQSAGRLRRTTK